MNKNKGFTLIELLVVIAIIGILSSVVLASLSSARDKGKDAAVKSQLASMKAQAELYYASGETYTGLCAAAQATLNGFGGTAGPGLFSAAHASSGTSATISVNNNPAGNLLTASKCNDSAEEWAVAVPLSDGTHMYCADNTGLTKEVTANLVAAATVCP